METLGSKAVFSPNELPRPNAELEGPEPSPAPPVGVVGMKGRSVLAAAVGLEAALEEEPSPGRCQGGRACVALESKMANREKGCFSVFNQLQLIRSWILVAFL